MKQLFTLLIGVFLTASSWAKCSNSGLWVFPGTQKIKQNSIFVLDGFASSQQIILGLNTKYPVYLKSGNRRVRLNVIEVCVGQFYITQAILKLETELEAGLIYTMFIDSLPEYQTFGKLNRATGEFESVVYTVVSEKDTSKPVLRSRPKELKKTLIHYGCGPAVNVVFNCPVKDDSELIVKTTVKNLSTGQVATYFIEPRDGKIEVGHDMCSGAFVYDNSSNYEIEFSYMDASGNLTPWTGERIKFTKPT